MKGVSYNIIVLTLFCSLWLCLSCKNNTERTNKNQYIEVVPTGMNFEMIHKIKSG